MTAPQKEPEPEAATELQPEQDPQNDHSQGARMHMDVQQESLPAAPNASMYTGGTGTTSSSMLGNETYQATETSVPVPSQPQLAAESMQSIQTDNRLGHDAVGPAMGTSEQLPSPAASAHQKAPRRSLPPGQASQAPVNSSPTCSSATPQTRDQRSQHQLQYQEQPYRQEEPHHPSQGGQNSQREPSPVSGTNTTATTKNTITSTPSSTPSPTIIHQQQHRHQQSAAGMRMRKSVHHVPFESFRSVYDIAHETTAFQQAALSSAPQPTFSSQMSYSTQTQGQSQVAAAHMRAKLSRDHRTRIPVSNQSSSSQIQVSQLQARMSTACPTTTISKSGSTICDSHSRHSRSGAANGKGSSLKHIL